MRRRIFTVLSVLNKLFFGHGDTKRLNTIGLCGDLDDVELIIDIEKRLEPS
jgi:hypothetical protein